jgi:hypothetical protein
MDIVSRVKNILMTPKTEWAVIAVEPTDIAKLYTGYIMLLALIPALATLVSFAVIGIPFGAIISTVVVNYIVGLIAVMVVAFIASKLAPMFDGRDDLVQGLKLVAYSYTSFWVGSIFLLIPVLGWVVVLVAGLYGLYLLYLGATPTMGVPESKAVIFILALIVAGIVIGLVIGAINRATGPGLM